MGEVSFTGGAPYDLPFAQSAKAEAVEDTVQLTFDVLADGQQGSKLIHVHVRMTHDVARGLAAQMQPCAVTAERRALHK